METQVAGATTALTRGVGDLFDKGVLGIFCLFLIYVAVHLFKALRAEGKEHAEELKRLNKEHADELKNARDAYDEEMRETVKSHREEMQVFLERHSTKAETWVAQGAEMTVRFNSAFDRFLAVTEALAKRSSKQQAQQP
ncbi:MAG: hypothetical protein EPN91_06580 [Salinibacterium sp.]|nr:MAG: hypothetical protein EPN91_06580 [Salinibacterium sp.]